MDIKTHMQQYLISKQNINDILCKIDELENKTNALCKPLSANEIQRTTSGNSTEDKVILYIDQVAMYENEIDIERSICNSIERNIAEMNNGRLKSLLFDKYCLGRSLMSIATECDMSYFKIKELHCKALMEYAMVNGFNFTEPAGIFTD